ncbi:hypothetical protein DERF_013274 [Dermatophagoides farinae]|uniref:Uncharacterized protein n=1 Tax=Dermatophagoides farinae TaxID=6954 RepID=A0A922HLS4_DERFA|nr:hypothetical protein DERF_013274 [Dermatophagoides farinae]
MEIMFGQCFTCPLPKLIDDMTHFLNVTKINDQIDKIQCNITLLDYHSNLVDQHDMDNCPVYRYNIPSSGLSGTTINVDKSCDEYECKNSSFEYSLPSKLSE